MMRRSLKPLLLILGLGAGFLSAQDAAPRIPSSQGQDAQVRKTVEVEKDDPELRRNAERAWFGGEPTFEYLQAKKSLAQQEAARWAHTLPGFKGQLPAIPGATATWVNLGPRKSTFSVYSGPAPAYPDVDSGRLSVQGVLTDPTNPQVLYLATSGGGLWKTTNADLAAAGDWTWTPVTDGLPTATSTGNVSIGAIAMSPADSNTIYLGLGDQVDATGVGLYKTINGGASWAEMGAIGTTTRTMSLLGVTANTILVGGNAGMYRSTNGGTSFVNIPLGAATSDLIWSIQRVGGSATNLVASKETSAGLGSFWWSGDGGATWTLGILDALATAQNPGRITVRGTPASATTVYAFAENKTTGLVAKGVFKSTNGGHNWTFLAAPTAQGGLFQPWGGSGDGDQAWYNQCIAVDPANDQNLFMASNLSLYRSTTGGASWIQMTSWDSTNWPYAHADFHTSYWSQTGPSTLFLGNDGGLCVVRDPFRASPPFTANAQNYATVDVTYVDNRRNRGITSHLIYNVGSTIASTPSDSRYRVTLGLQDLSSRVRVDEGTGLQNSSTWNDPTATGDGLGTVISPTNGNNLLVSSYYATPKKSIDGGANWSTASAGIVESGSSTNAPFHTLIHLGLADATGNTAYTCSNVVLYKTANWAATAWTPIPMGGFGGTLIRNFAISALNANKMAIAANGGIVWVTSNGGTTWTNAAGADITGGQLNLSYVWFNTTNDSTLYAASVGLTITGHHLWKSTNSGSSWAAIDGPGNGFPFGIPVHVIKNDPSTANRILAGTDFGVYISENGGTSWARYGLGIPMVATKDLYIAPDGTFVRAGTFGRGLWEISGGTAPAGPTITAQPQSATVTLPAPATFSVSATGTGTLTYQWRKTGNDIAGATSSTYTTPFTSLGDNGASFTVNVTDSTGSTLSNPALLTVNACGGGGGGTSQLLQNPGFESGDDGSWTTENPYIIDNSASPVARTGSWKAWMGSYTSSHTDYLYQTVSIPSNATVADLTFWQGITGGLSASPRNTCTLKVQSSTGADLITLDSWDNTQATGSYLQRSYQLLAYKGQTVRIYFTSYQPGASGTGTAFLLDDFTLNVTTPGTSYTLPVISTHPASQSLTVGQAATFTVATSAGTAPLYYQWRKGGTPIPGATSTSYSISSVQFTDAGSFDVQIANCAGTVTSNPATLTVGAPVSVSITPSTTTSTVPGGQLSFTATVTGSANTAVTWTLSGGGTLSSTTSNPVTFTAPSAATTSSLTATSVASASATATVLITTKTGDLTGDGVNDILDLATFARAYGSHPGDGNWFAAADLNGDGVVNDLDLALFFALAGF